jgi:glutamate racemase
MPTTTKKNSLPIGVFDSGVGGLTVLRALQQQLPQETFLYLGDTARLPYGTKSPATVIRYSNQACKHLINRGIKLLVVACNTATALALSALQENFPRLPIIGVIEPGAQAACATSVNGQIAVIATEATVNAGSYQKAIKKIRPEANVIAQGCSLFVPLAEEGWVDDDIADAVAKRYLEPLLIQQANFKPDCLVLGCTHFPILLSPIKKVAGKKIAVIDSAKTTAEAVKQVLENLKLKHTANNHSSPHNKFLVTDAPERFIRIAQLFLGTPLHAKDIELIELTQNTR